MTKYITLFITFLSLIGLENTNDSFKTIQNSLEIKETNSITVNDPLYNITVAIKKTKDAFNLVISVDLKNGSYYVSPNSKEDYTGMFYMDFGDYKNVSFNGKLQENQLDNPKIGPLPEVKDPENNVFGNTIFTQKLKIKTTADFDVYGRIKFVIEPRCSMENIPFMISFKNGKMSIKKATC